MESGGGSGEGGGTFGAEGKIVCGLPEEFLNEGELAKSLRSLAGGSEFSS